MSENEVDIMANGGPAFPALANTWPNITGMSLRDWFAGMSISWAASMQERHVATLVHNGADFSGLSEDEFNRAASEGIADLSYTVADAMLARRVRP